MLDCVEATAKATKETRYNSLDALINNNNFFLGNCQLPEYGT
jgi:hypothetical protein